MFNFSKMFKKFNNFSSVDIGIDLGTANVFIYVKGKGIVLKEPSVVAIEQGTKKVLAVGEEAHRMLGRTPANIVAIRPLKEGIIADYTTTERMLNYFIKKVTGSGFFSKPRAMICIPAGITSVEKRAVFEAGMEAGVKDVYLIEEPLAAALGAGLEIANPCGNMILDIGGGTSDAAVLSLGGIVVNQTLRVGGDKFDEAIVKYVKREYNLIIGEQTAELIKISVGSVCPFNSKNEKVQVRGRDIVSGLPKMFYIDSLQVKKAVSECAFLIVSCVKQVLEQNPPELTSDIIDKGVVLTGGGSLIHGLDALLNKETGVPVCHADDPLSCVALGTGKALESLEFLKSHVVQFKR